MYFFRTLWMLLNMFSLLFVVAAFVLSFARRLSNVDCFGWWFQLRQKIADMAADSLQVDTAFVQFVMI